MKSKIISKFLVVLILVAIVAMAVSVNVSAGGECGSKKTGTNNSGTGSIAQNSVKEGTFYVYQGGIQYENGKPVIRLFSTTWCPHCSWIKDTFDKVAKEYVENGEIIAYHWEIDTGDNTLTPEVETEVPQSELAIFKTFNPRGSIPTFVFGEKYWRIGNGYERQNDLSAEEYEFRTIIYTLLNKEDTTIKESWYSSEANYHNIDIVDAKYTIESNKDIVVIDVRTISEYKSGHISDAISIPLLSLKQRINELDKEDSIIVYCKGGSRSEEACKILTQNGFENIFNLEGGIDAWSFAGYEIVESTDEKSDSIIENTITAYIDYVDLREEQDSSA